MTPAPIDPHVLLVSRMFPPVLGVGALRTAGFARELSHAGWTVTALTVHRRSLSPALRDDSLDAWVPPAVRRLEARDAAAELGARIRRGFSDATPAAAAPATIIRRPGGTVAGRIWRWFTLPDLALTWACAAVVAGRRAARDASVVYSCGLPLGSHLAAWAIARTVGRAWVCDFRDPYVWPGVRRFATPIHQACGLWLERRIVRAADHVVVANDAFARYFLSRYPESRPKLSSILNGYDGALADPVEAGTGPLKLAHAGQFQADGALRALVQAIAAARGMGRSIELCLLGTLTAAQHDLVERSGVRDAVSLLGRVPHGEVDGILSRADVLLAESCGAIAPIAVRAKIFEYVRCRKPVLALTDCGSALEEVVTREGLGYAIDPGQPAALVDALVHLDTLKAAGRPLFPGPSPDVRRFSRTARTRELERVLRHVMAARRGRSREQEPGPAP